MRVVVLCNPRLSRFDLAVLNNIRLRPELQVVGMVINSRKQLSAFQRVRRELRKGRGGYVVVQITRKLFNRKRIESVVTADFCTTNGIPFVFTENLYNQQTIAWINSRDPKVLLLRGFGIIKEPVLSIAPLGVLSYHHGDLRKYRGGPPGFWELYNGETEMGITIQILDSGLDTGTIILQRFVPISKSTTWNSLRQEAYKQSETLAAEALLMLRESGSFRNPEGTKGRLYTLPNLTQWLSLQLKVIKRRFLQL